MRTPRFAALKNIGLRAKFVLLISILLIGLFSLFAYYIVSTRTAALRTNLYKQAEAFTTLATEPIGNTFAIYKDSGTAAIDRSVRETIQLNDNVVNIAVVDITGTVLFQHNDAAPVTVTAAEAASFEPAYRYNERGAIDTIIYPYFEASGAHRFSVAYVISDAEIEQAIRQDTLSSLVFVVFGLLATAASVYLLINLLIIRPIESVSEQAEHISSGDLNQQIHISSQDEIGTLGSSVNRMADSLKKHIAELKEVDKVKSEFMMITSHNLRTPLTIISGYMENADRYAHDPAKLTQILGRISTSVDRLEMFAEDVLTISQFELGAQSKDLQTLDFKPFIEEIVAKFQAQADDKKISLEADLPIDGVMVHASGPHIRSAIWNLLDNALKFTPEGGSVHVAAEAHAGKVRLTVRDNGIGIKQVEIPKLFTKFHRGTSTLTYDFGGTGIGLYASKVMVESYGGTITVQSQEGKGSSFTIALPCSASPQRKPIQE